MINVTPELGPELLKKAIFYFLLNFEKRQQKKQQMTIYFPAFYLFQQSQPRLVSRNVTVLACHRAAVQPTSWWRDKNVLP